MEITTKKKCKFCSADEVVDLGQGVGHCKKCCRLQTVKSEPKKEIKKETLSTIHL